MKNAVAMMIAAVAMSALTTCAAAQEKVELDAKYIDARNGFSLCPPGGTERMREMSPLRLVSWRKRSDDGKVVVYTLTVISGREGESRVDMREHLQRTVEQLRKAEGLEVDSSKVITAAGQEAMDICGQTPGRRKVWTRQAWVQSQPGVFLILKITGPGGRKGELNAVFDAVLPTLEVFQPGQAEARRAANLARGQALLAALTDKKLVDVLQPQAQWFLFRKKGQPVGFMKVEESQARRDGASGIELKTFVRARVENGSAVTCAAQVMFATADRKVELWRRALWAGVAPGEMQPMAGEEGAVKDDAVTCSLTENGPPKTLKKQVPAGNVPIYLPKAVNAVLWRVVDLGKKQTYSFAIYNARANAFDMRTLEVLGPEPIELDGQKVPAVRVTDQFAEDEAAETTWVDAKGRLIKAERGDLVLTASTKAEVLKQFSDAEAVARKMTQ